MGLYHGLNVPLQVLRGGPDGRKVILMPCMAPTDQLKLSSDQLSWSAGARFGKNLAMFVIIKNAIFRSLIDAFPYANSFFVNVYCGNIRYFIIFGLNSLFKRVFFLVLRLLEEYIREDAQESLSFKTY